jgi:hypothetical protein
VKPSPASVTLTWNTSGVTIAVWRSEPPRRRPLRSTITSRQARGVDERETLVLLISEVVSNAVLRSVGGQRSQT